jgi:hypothetical protein
MVRKALLDHEIFSPERFIEVANAANLLQFLGSPPRGFAA